MALLKSGITDWDEGFALLRERFGVDSDRYEELFDEAGQRWSMRLTLWKRLLQTARSWCCL